MLIKSDKRDCYTRENVRNGKGSIHFSSLLKPENSPKKLSLCSEILLKPKCGVGEHSHPVDEVEIYFCLSGQGQVLDGGKYIDFKIGDTAITDGGNAHAIVNTGKKDLRFIAIIISN